MTSIGLPTGLSNPALRALAEAGIVDLIDVAARTEREIARLHGMGPKGVRMLAGALADAGLRFASP